jgi:hypothetical protein
MISGTLTGTQQSASFAPSNGVSDVIIDMNGAKGQVFLMAKATNTGWAMATDKTGAFSVMTPDTSIVYAFFGKAVDGVANYYMGP